MGSQAGTADLFKEVKSDDQSPRWEHLHVHLCHVTGRQQLQHNSCLSSAS